MQAIGESNPVAGWACQCTVGDVIKSSWVHILSDMFKLQSQYLWCNYQQTSVTDTLGDKSNYAYLVDDWTSDKLAVMSGDLCKNDISAIHSDNKTTF